MRFQRSVLLSFALTLAVLPVASIFSRQSAFAQQTPAPAINQNGTTIKETYAGHFLIGTAADVPGGFTEQELALIKGNFNIITPENYLKPAAIHPAENIWSYGRTDVLIQWCLDNNIKVHGHTLSWHGQTNPWFFEGGDKQAVTKRLQGHITTLVGHYKGKIYSWDVVNEAINDAPNPETENLRPSQWTQNIGPEFLTIAFKAAHAADPDAKLYYNDYGIENGAKHVSSMHLLKRLLADGAPVYGVGIQGHWSTSNLPYDALDKAIADYASLGLKVSISELDITVAGASGGQLGAGAPGTPGGFGGGRIGRGNRGQGGVGIAGGNQGGPAATQPGARGDGPGFGGAAGFGGGRGGRGGTGGASSPALPTVINAADSIRRQVTDLSEDQRTRLTTIAQDLTSKLAAWQTSSQEALLVIQPQYTPGQLAYDYEIAHYNQIQFQQFAQRDAMINEAEIALVAILAPSQAQKWQTARLKDLVTSRLRPVGLTDAQTVKADAIIATHAPKVLEARDRDALLAAKAAFWKEIVGILDNAQLTVLLAPSQDGAGGRGGRGASVATAEGLKAQADAYARVFAIFEKHKNTVERVTFWGLNDRRSWRAGENPLIFDINNQRKPAYDAIVNALLHPPVQE